MEKEHIIINQKDECCGCSACYSICPTDAILMKADEEGFLYPSVNNDRCIKCGLCIDVCPLKKVSENTVHQDYYATKNNCEIVRKCSTSGGVFSLLAQYVIERNGAIYGAAFDEDYKVIHKRETGDNWECFRGAKYVQSDMQDVFEQVKVDLDNENFVLFSGTPCQVAGLKVFLQKKKTNTSNLITCDLVCHGVPSPMVWKDYLQSIVPDTTKIGKISFRSKEGVGWHNSRLQVTDRENRDIINLKQGTGVYLGGFSNNITLRPSCYSCKYTNYNREGDFTLGDFWGIEKVNQEFDDNKGISLLMVNSEQGRKIWNEIKKQTTYVVVNKEECEQPNLVSPSRCYGNRAVFWKSYRSFGLEAAGKIMGYIEMPKAKKIAYSIVRKVLAVINKLSLKS